MDIAKRLLKRREELGWAQKEAAHKIGITPQFLGKIEKGEREPSHETMEKIAQAYGVSVDWIYDLPDAPKPITQKSLPEGGSEILKYLSGMSKRGRQEAINLVKALADTDRTWTQYEMIINALEVLGAYDIINTLAEDDLIAIRGFRLDGVSVVLDQKASIIKIVPLEQPSQRARSTE